jgi:hypothetical protein
MQLEGTPGQRLGIYLAESGTPDYDAMVLLDLTAPAGAESQPRNNAAVTDTNGADGLVKRCLPGRLAWSQEWRKL